jgi:hypothetical protein
LMQSTSQCLFSFVIYFQDYSDVCFKNETNIFQIIWYQSIVQFKLMA